ncbi:hypothetical protein [Pelotomaculum propionicicum]|uniref:hypothetical protein n=1 Tax=Pelotomaculum propionicicum TaxID=258475 RepID=UPI0010663EF5|nr:hypothetical protein [Pelotomaculum propionicicum]
MVGQFYLTSLGQFYFTIYKPGRREARPPVKKPPTILAGIIGIILLNSASFCLPAFGAGQREGAGRR